MAADTTVDERFAELAGARSPQVRSELIVEHLYLARRVAARFSRRSHPFDDLVQVASLALVKAVDRFRPELGNQFVSYATVTILGELKRFFRDQGWSLRTPRRLQELYLELGPATDELTQELRRSPTVDELSARLGADSEVVLEAMEAGQSYAASSLDVPDDDGEMQGDRIAVQDPGYERAEQLATMKSSLRQLPERDQTILKLRYFHDMSQSEIAKEVGISQMQVSRLLSRSVASLQAAS